MTQAGDARTLACPCAPGSLSRCIRLIEVLRRSPCDTGEEEGDEDPTGDLERQRVKGIQILQPWAPFGSTAPPEGWRVFLAGRCQRTTARGGGRWMVPLIDGRALHQ